MKQARQRRASTTIQERAWPFNPTKYTDHIPNLDGQRRQLVSIIDDHGFNWQVFAVAASGFFTDSYNLFVSNVILPALAFVYWPCEHEANTAITINALTLAGSAVGQVMFGFLADKYGRQRLYGVELFIVIFSTIGLAQCSRGILHTNADGSTETSMSVEAWLMAWRFVMGIGIGAEYPLSACITAEWSATNSRGRMMSAVFLMQPIGQLMAWVVGISTVTGLSYHYDLQIGKSCTSSDHADIGIDIFWRIVVGVGAVPALVAILFRWTIPESGRFTYDVLQDANTALKDTRKVYDNQPVAARQSHELEGCPPEGANDGYDPHAIAELGPRLAVQSDAPSIVTAELRNSSFGGLSQLEQWDLPSDEPSYSQFTYAEMHTYFIKEGNWRYLAGTSLAWLLLDFAFYGLGFNSPGTMAKLWTETVQPNGQDTPSWLLNSPHGDNGTIYQVLRSNAKECMITTSIASILGSISMVMLINQFDRRVALIWSFVALAGALLVLGVAFLYLFHTPNHIVLIVLYALIQFGFAIGPNTLTFIIPAEIFPTRYRCTAYGIAAASGKLGSVLVQVAFLFFDKGGMKDPDSKALGYIIFMFAGFMLLGGLVSWAWIPSVQEREDAKPHRLQNKTLEVLAGGVAVMSEDEKVGFRVQGREIASRLRQW